MSPCWIALGGNLGSVAETFRQAESLLNGWSGISVIRMSRLYTTSPVGADAGSEFLNAAAELQTSLSPQEILLVLQAVETQLGRERTVRWGPRTLDLDLLLYGQQSVSQSNLTVPHPHMWYRRFVLDPLAEIAANAMHCVHRLSVAELRSHLLTRPLSCSLLGATDAYRDQLLQQLGSEFREVKWQLDAPEEAWLAFCLDSVLPAFDVAAANRIDVHAFPTTPEQTIRDVLGAALGAVRIVE